MDEYGLEPDAVDVSLVCTPVTAECPTSGVTIIVTVSTRVRLPLVPEILGLDRSTAVPVQAEAVQKVSRSWGAR